jgi:hypothetical protein
VSDAQRYDVRVTSSAATDEEVAVATAVVTASLEELAGAANPIVPPVSAWSRSQRNLRSTLTPGPGAWRGFFG